MMLELMEHVVARENLLKAYGRVVLIGGIPTVLDRFIQQALHQVLSPLWETDFSDSSYGFREGRSAHQAILAAKEYIQEGRTFVVDLDLEKFFDRVQHDVLMAKVARKIGDKRVLKLIRRYLQAGLMKGGLVEVRRESSRSWADGYGGNCEPSYGGSASGCSPGPGT